MPIVSKERLRAILMENGVPNVDEIIQNLYGTSRQQKQLTTDVVKQALLEDRFLPKPGLGNLLLSRFTVDELMNYVKVKRRRRVNNAVVSTEVNEFEEMDEVNEIGEVEEVEEVEEDEQAYSFVRM